MKFISLLMCVIVASNQSTVSALTSNIRTSKASSSPLLSSTILEPAAVSQAQPAFDRVAWETGFSTCKKEVCEVISTSMPLDIKGTYYRNGHAKFEAGKDLYLHPFDGDGMITAVTIQNGSALFRNRFVRTNVFNKERKARRVVSRGAFGTPVSGGILSNIFRLKLRDVANTNVVFWGRRLLALFESSTPHLIEADSLRTIGESTVNGLLKSKQPFSAHPRIDANTNRLISFSSIQGSKSAQMTVFEFDTAFKLVSSRPFEVPGFVFFHDFLVTKNYYLFTKVPTDFSPLPFLLGKKGPAECISFDSSRPCEVFIVPRDPSQPVQVVPVDPHFNFHYANGYEDELTGDIIFDTIRCSKMELGKTSGRTTPVWIGLDYAESVPFSQLVRYTLSKDPSGSTGSSKWSVAKRDLSSTQLDFPSLNPRVVGKKNRFVFASAGSDPKQSSPLQGLAKLDLDEGTETSWFPAPHEFLGEVVFVPKSSSSSSSSDQFSTSSSIDDQLSFQEDDGYLITYAWDGKEQKSSLLIFDAKNIALGPISRSAIPTNVPFGLHGCFAPDLVFDEKETKNKFTAFSGIDRNNWNEVKGGFSGLGISVD